MFAEICRQVRPDSLIEHTIHFGGLEMRISTQRSLFIPDKRILMISDCHLGKATHFRKNAMPLPKNAGEHDILRLDNLLKFYRPDRMIILGDLFHSEWNEEWDNLTGLIRTHDQVQWMLVKGNHDILHESHYTEAGLITANSHELGPLLLTHEPEPHHEKPVIMGHIHPGYRIRGKGRQSAMLPVFHVGEKRLVMPAFGNLTGRVHLEKESEQDRIYCFTDRTFFEI